MAVTVLAPRQSSSITRIRLIVSSNTTLPSLTNTDYIVFVSGAITVTLPTAVDNTNNYTFIKTDSGSNTTIATTSSQTIAFYPSVPDITVLLTKQGIAMPVYSDNANWWTA